MTSNKNLSQKQNGIERRRFLKGVACSAAVLSLCGDSSAAAIPDNEGAVLPTVSDSLIEYAELVDEIRDAYLRIYVADFIRINTSLQEAYKKVVNLAKDLEKEVPELRSGGSSSQLTNLASAGLSSASALASNANGGGYVTNVALVSFTTDSIKSEVERVERDSITLSSKATALLRQLLEEVRKLEPILKSIDDATKALADAGKRINPKLKSIQKHIHDAAIVTLKQEFSNSPNQPTNSSVANEKAKQLIEEAIAELEMNDFISSNHPEIGEKAKWVRGLLVDCRDWLSKGGTVALLNREYGNVAYTKVSSNGPATPLGVWWGVRQILAEYLPEAIRLRTISCIALIAPVLITGWDQPTKEAKIRSLLPYIRPSSDSNFNDQQVAQAAARLAKL